MVKLIVYIVGILIFLFLSVNVASALSPSLAEAIKGLPLGDQILIVARKVDSLDQKVTEQDQTIKNQQDALSSQSAKLDQQIKCQELKQTTPKRGNIAYISKDIVGFYEDAQKSVAESQAKSDSAQVATWQSIVAEAKPMYDAYIKQCGK